MKIIRTDYLTGERRVAARYDDVTTHFASSVLEMTARSEAEATGAALQFNIAGGLSGKSAATLFDANGLPSVHYHQEWPQE